MIQKKMRETMKICSLLITAIILTFTSTLTVSASPSAYLKSDVETKEMYNLIEQGKDYLGLMRIYARFCGGIKVGAVDYEKSGYLYTAGLLNYEKGKNPAFVYAAYRSETQSPIQYEIVTFDNLNPYSSEYLNNYSGEFSNQDTRVGYTYKIFSKDGIDYIKEYRAYGFAEAIGEDVTYYKFDGKELRKVCGASESTEFGINSSNAEEIQRSYYEINGKSVTKEKYDEFTNGFKQKQTLFGNYLDGYFVGDFEGINDYQYLLNEFSKVPSTITIDIDGICYDFKDKPINVNGNTLAPLRAVGEAMGAEVTWDTSTKKITVAKDGYVIELKVGSKIVYAYPEGTKPDEIAALIASEAAFKETIDAPATLIGNKVYVPVRFIVESLEGEVDYNKLSKEIVIKEQTYFYDTEL